MTLHQRLNEAAYRILTDGRVHDTRAVLWAHQELNLPLGAAYPREELGPRPSFSERRIAERVQGVLA